MSYRTKILAGVLGLGLFAQGAQAASLCKPDIVGITLIEGNYDPPASMPPDAENLKDTGAWPKNLIMQGWHNLRAAHRPLTLVCRFKGRPNEAFTLPDDTNSCELTYNGGLIFECRH
jgi:hypothetical protein